MIFSTREVVENLKVVPAGGTAVLHHTSKNVCTLLLIIGVVRAAWCSQGLEVFYSAQILWNPLWLMKVFQHDCCRTHTHTRWSESVLRWATRPSLFFPFFPGTYLILEVSGHSWESSSCHEGIEPLTWDFWLKKCLQEIGASGPYHSILYKFISYLYKELMLLVLNGVATNQGYEPSQNRRMIQGVTGGPVLLERTASKSIIVSLNLINRFVFFDVI